MSYAPFIAIAAATAAFISGLLAMLSWQGSLMVAIASAVLAGGIAFTIMEMQRLAKREN